jgi:hypothetical protein
MAPSLGAGHVDLVSATIGAAPAMDEVPEHPYRRQAATLVASWEAYARHPRGAYVSWGDGAAICVFPTEPERGVFNNALLERGMDAGQSARAVDAVEAAYRDASIDRYAAWAHESEPTLIAELTTREYRLDTSTREMAMRLDRLSAPRPDLRLADLDWDGYVRGFGVPPGLLAGAEAAVFHLRVARLDGRVAGAILAFDREGDCGIYNLEPSMRRAAAG